VRGEGSIPSAAPSATAVALGAVASNGINTVGSHDQPYDEPSLLSGRAAAPPTSACVGAEPLGRLARRSAARRRRKIVRNPGESPQTLGGGDARRKDGFGWPKGHRAGSPRARSRLGPDPSGAGHEQHQDDEGNRPSVMPSGGHHGFLHARRAIAAPPGQAIICQLLYPRALGKTKPERRWRGP